MRLDDERASDNVEDRRGRSPRKVALGGGAGAIIIALIAAWLTGKNPLQLIAELAQQGGAPQAEQAPGAPVEDSPQTARLKDFVSRVLGSTERVWTEQFRRLGKNYVLPTLVMFTGTVNSGCGFAQSAMGPFYCPADQKLYIDLSFYEELARRHGAPGDAAQAYVIAHEVGHHVQNLLGISDRVHAAKGQVSEAEYNKLSVRLELQADFFAGLWVHVANKEKRILEPGDVEEALNAASAIGDDRLQKQARGHVVPDSFTHGTSAQRARWFRLGLDSGDFNQGDTFKAKDL